VIALVQRVTEARVTVEEQIVGSIGRGILALVGVERGDAEGEARRLGEKLMGYRLFNDPAGKMNLSLREIGGELLLVPQFTLAADTNSGARPSFSTAAPPEEGKRLFDYLVNILKPAATGRFGADMKVSLVNDGPVTFWLQVSPAQNKS
jgi:D-aminoacyl-tRNA deacylase